MTSRPTPSSQKAKSFTEDDIFIGLMSGTSIDAIDVVAVSFGDQSLTIHGSYSQEISAELKTRIIELNTPSDNELHKTMTLDQELGELFAETINKLLAKTQLKPEQITAIGSHGQTIRHQVETQPFYTLQIGNPHIIAERTGICTIADFRTRDMVVGGQGAPLVPAFHKAMLSSKVDRIILNIGGMANVTFLYADGSVKGFDTGPGNVLMDMWIAETKQLPFDKDGNWAKSGTINSPLLNTLLKETFFQQTPPKSTGRDLFNRNWLEENLKNFTDSSENIQSSLLALTIESIAKAIESWGPESGELYVCGGGANNSFLMEALNNRLQEFSVSSTTALSLDPDWVEACAFAWFAKSKLENKKIDNTITTGARSPTYSGILYNQ